MEQYRDVVLDVVERDVREINSSFAEPLLKYSRLGNIGAHVRLAKGGARTVQFRPNHDLANPGFSGTADQFSESLVKPLLLTLLK